MTEAAYRSPDGLSGVFGKDAGEPVPEVIPYTNDTDIFMHPMPLHLIDPHSTPGLQVTSQDYSTEEMMALRAQGETGGWVSRTEEGITYWHREEVVRNDGKELVDEQ